MLDRIAHRGPDARAINSQANAKHGHVRLSLLDLSAASNQPFKYKGALLSYNGELWNWKSLRKILESEGYTFKTKGDTEVLAAWLNKYGIKGLTDLDGMFAFAWTCHNNQTWLVRDSFGKVPLYVAKVGNGFAWASERKAFHPKARPISVPPGYAFHLNDAKWQKWYTLPNPDPLSSKEVLSLLEQGVRNRLDADAPVCCLISGGLDSSIILSLAKEYRHDVVAYTAVYNDKANDTQSARRLCKEFSVPLVEVPVNFEQSSIKAALTATEIPSKAQTEIAILCLPLARRIAEDGFKACLSGEAADEIFGGYGNFCIQASKDKRPDSIRKLRLQLLEKMSRGNFIRCNKVFMAHGVECRLPFMEQKLVESAIQMDLSESPAGKVLLKSAAKNVVPSWCIKRPKDTFQGGSGLSKTIENQISSPIKYYNSELKKIFGYLPKG